MTDGWYEGGHQGAFAFRYSFLSDGRLTVWFRFDDFPEFGPAELAKAEADELGSLIETMTTLLERALTSARSQAPEDEDERAPRAYTDPSALRRKRPRDDEP